MESEIPPAGRPSSVRGVVWGATLGLLIVGAFVAGTRMAASHATAAAAAPAGSANPAGAPAQPSTGVLAVAVPSAPAQPIAAPSGGLALVSPPSIDANLLPVAKRPRLYLRTGHPKPASAKPAQAQTLTAPPPATPVAQEETAQASDPAPDDSAPSLIPVIPAAPKPTVDPFVRAVQQDIQEDESQGR
jgi:hypothetical protein